MPKGIYVRTEQMKENPRKTWEEKFGKEKAEQMKEKAKINLEKRRNRGEFWGHPKGSKRSPEELEKHSKSMMDKNRIPCSPEKAEKIRIAKTGKQYKKHKILFVYKLWFDNDSEKRRYWGCCYSIRRRLTFHRNTLLKGTSPHLNLQLAANKFGTVNLQYAIVAKDERDYCLNMEKQLIKWDSTCYNMQGK
jgi:hypothetical protein